MIETEISPEKLGLLSTGKIKGFLSIFFTRDLYLLFSMFRRDNRNTFKNTLILPFFKSVFRD